MTNDTFVPQVRFGRVQCTVVACDGRKHQGSAVLLTGAHTGAHATLPYSGSSRLTHTLSLCSAVCAPLSRTPPYRTVTRGFTRATDFLCPLPKYVSDLERLSRYRVRTILRPAAVDDSSRVKSKPSLFYSE